MMQMNHGRARAPLRLIGLVLVVSLVSPTAGGWAASPAGEDGAEGLEQEMMILEDIPSIYTASKFEQKATEAPASISIVTADEIERYGYRTIGDVLRSLPGFYLTNDRNYGYIGVRGFSRPEDYNSRVLFLVDGQRMNDPSYGYVGIGMDFGLDVDLIDRVEVIRGPGSSLYGTNALLAVVNVITRRGRDLQGAEVSGQAASFDTYGGRATYGKRFPNRVELLLSGSIYDSEGHGELFFPAFQDPATNNGVAMRADGGRADSVFAKLGYGDVTLQGLYSQRKKRIPTGSYDTVFNNRGNHTWDDLALVSLDYRGTIAPKVSLDAKLFYGYAKYKGNFVYDWADEGEPPLLVVNDDSAEDQWWGGEAQLGRRFSLLGSHYVTAGVEFRDAFQEDQFNEDLEVYLDHEGDELNWALYLQDEFEILRSLRLNAGFRYDHYDSFGGTVSPRVALLYQPRRSTVLKFVYGQAFRAPDGFELYYEDSGLTQVAPDSLDEERLETYEVVVEQYIGNALRGSVSGFWNNFDDLIDLGTNEDGISMFENVGKVETHGVELALEGKWRKLLSGRFSYTYADTEDERTGAQLTNSPEHLVKLNLSIALLVDKVFASTETRYVSERDSNEGGVADAATIVDLTLLAKELDWPARWQPLGWKLFRGATLSASIYNLFDEDQEHPFFAHGEGVNPDAEADVLLDDGRTFRVKLDLEF